MTARRPSMKRAARAAIAIAGLLVLAVFAAPGAHANWLTHILKEAGDAAGSAARHADVPDTIPGGRSGRLAHVVGKLNDAPDHALAASATPEGHWQFVNKKGEVFTAGTPDEMQRVMPTLAPGTEAAQTAPMILFIGEDTVGSARAALDLLPATAQLNLVTSTGTFPLARAASGWQALVRPNLSLRLGRPDLDREAFAFLSRTLNRAEIRTLSVADGGPKSLASTPRIDPDSKLPLVDTIDPAHINRAFGALRGQTALIVGRIENGLIRFGSGAPRALDDIITAARDADVNVIVLDVPSARQPGGRNWLWQRVNVPGLSDAAKKTVFADFIDELAGRQGRLVLTSAPSDRASRFQLQAVSDASRTGVIDSAGSWLGDVVEFVTGDVLPHAISMDLNDKDTQSNLDLQIFPWLPLWLQNTLLVSTLAGVFAFSEVRLWWARIWPRAPRQAGQNAIWHFVSQVPRRILMLIGFLPLVGLPALAMLILRQVSTILMAPVRLFRWLTGWLTGRRAA